ncbi:hypothetical protein ACFWA9_10120 [Kitasatospora sp. NPDC059973]|uniref:hypothetical protein n=1 Tax=Kitasatospora sp. NPDC059973 TaxID=3347020 RepID=UPI0036A652AA
MTSNPENAESSAATSPVPAAAEPTLTYRHPAGSVVTEPARFHGGKSIVLKPVTDHDPAGSLDRWAMVPSRRGGEGKTTAELPLAVMLDEASSLLAATAPHDDEVRALLSQIMREGRKTTSPEDWDRLIGLDHRPTFGRQYATVEELDAAARAELGLGRETPESN